MKIESTGAAVGAHVSDVDVRDLSDDEIATLDAAWAEHGVLFFRGQHLSPDEHLAFAERFAPVDVNRFFTPVDGHPSVAQVLKEPDQTRNIGGGWHTDHSYDDAPARGSILLAHEVPPSGGDTLFASVGASFDALSDGLKETLRGLHAWHTNEHIFGAQSEHAQGMKGRLHNPDAVSGAEHPVVIGHPVTGRPLLYVNMAFTWNFVGWSREDSKPLLDHLIEHTAKDEFTYRFEWEPGSIAMWDNRSTWHWAVNDYDGHRRLMHRVTISGGTLGAAA